MGRKKSFTLKTGLCAAFVVLFFLSVGMLARDLLHSAREREANEELVQRVEQGASPSQSSETSGTWQTPARNYLPLLQENSDLAAWLIIQGTQVDYPVLYTPEEPEYYLRRAFDGSYALSGSLFIGANCVPDGSNIIIYGHKMKDGSMFGSLEYYADESYARAHPEILYDRILPDGSYERLTFAVMAAFYSQVYQVDEENVFRYYYATDLSEPQTFQQYVDQVQSASLYDLGVTAEYGDRLLTLSTCSYYTEDGRFVVVARQCP